MRLGAYAAVVGSMVQQRRLDIIANNVANANSPGYKRDSLHFNNFLSEVTHTSMDQGPLRATGHKLDIALSGTGFLRVQTDQGVLYTRAGNLTLNNAKNLVTQDGWPVLGRNGPIRIENTHNMRFGEDGQVFDGDTPVDTLDIVQFPAGTQLRKIQGGYFEPESKDVQPAKAESCIVVNESLEGANFNPVEEMVRMVETMRSFEAYQKTMKIFDRDLDAQIIAKLSG